MESSVQRLGYRINKDCRRVSKLLDSFPLYGSIEFPELTTLVNNTNHAMDTLEHMSLSVDNHNLPVALEFANGGLRTMQNVHNTIKDLDPKKIASTMFHYPKETFSSSIQVIEPLDLIGDLKKPFEEIKNTMTGVFSKIENSMNRVIDSIEKIAQQAKGVMESIAKDVIKVMSQILQYVWAFVQFMYQLAVEITKFTAWLLTTVVKNFWKTPRAAMFIMCVLFYISSAFVKYVTNSIDSTVPPAVLTLIFTVYFLAYDPSSLVPLEDYITDVWSNFTKITYLQDPVSKKPDWGKIAFALLFSTIIVKFAVLDVLAMILAALRRQFLVRREVVVGGGVYGGRE